MSQNISNRIKVESFVNRKILFCTSYKVLQNIHNIIIIISLKKDVSGTEAKNIYFLISLFLIRQKNIKACL